MQEIINLQFLRFKSIQLRNMKPYLLLALLFLTTNVYGQTRNLRTELGMAYGSYSSAYNSLNVSTTLNVNLGGLYDFESFDESRWFNNDKQIRSYELSWSKRIRQSKNLRRELYLGVKVAGQFQHRTLFIGSKERLQEEMIIDQKTGTVRSISAFQTTALSELNDYINLSPNGFYRILFNDHFSMNSSLSTGILVPVRGGIQAASYNGQITRIYEGEELLTETRSYEGEITYDWYKSSFTPRFRVEAAVMAEFKPFSKKPYYLSVGPLLGQQLSMMKNNNFLYKGFRFQLQSQF
jgi:hypothetical protein